ncbi:redoxin domain-containing protein [Actinoplanes sp. NPDC023801]|uniref:redoxin domain-containing protein n=1 Tax=Actinoplanes sp. NPDC023801 TaxID=3154595 RepID=UPI0033ED9848
MKKLCLVLVAMTCTLAACGRDTPPAAPAPAPATTAATTAAAPAVSSSAAAPAPAQPVPAVLKFTGTTLDGAAFDGAGLAGKPAVFWFWAPWCPKCQAEGPAVAKVAEKYQRKVTVIGVAGLDRSTRKMAEFVERTGTAGIAQLDDRTGDLYKHFRVTSQSSYVFVDASGATESATGPLTEDELSSLVERHVL